MSLIDKTYFTGALKIAQKSEATVDADIQNHIDTYEPQFLTNLLGYPLYKALLAALIVDPVDQRFIDLLYGAEYTGRNAELKKYNGLIVYSDGLSVGTYIPPDIEFTVDVTAGIASGQPSYRNAFLEGKKGKYRIMERGTGQLLSTEYTQTGITNGFDLVGRNFNNGGVYTIQFIAPVPLPAPVVIMPNPLKVSPIANYVYWYWQKSNGTSSTGSGEVKLKGKNATPERPIWKMSAAWNKMVNMNREMDEFIYRSGMYPEYVSPIRNNSCDWNRLELFEVSNALGV